MRLVVLYGRRGASCIDLWAIGEEATPCLPSNSKAIATLKRRGRPWVLATMAPAERPVHHLPCRLGPPPTIHACSPRLPCVPPQVAGGFRMSRSSTDLKAKTSFNHCISFKLKTRFYWMRTLREVILFRSDQHGGLMEPFFGSPLSLSLSLFSLSLLSLLSLSLPTLPLSLLSPLLSPSLFFPHSLSLFKLSSLIISSAAPGSAQTGQRNRKQTRQKWRSLILSADAVLVSGAASYLATLLRRRRASHLGS